MDRSISTSSGESSKIIRQEDEAQVDPIHDGASEGDPIEWHNDHWDVFDEYWGPYIVDEPGLDWISTRICQNERSVPSDELYENPAAQNWLRKFAGLRKQDFPTLRATIADFPGLKTPKIPLFKDEVTQDEYQISLNFGYDWDGLERIRCPEVQSSDELRHPLRTIRYRIPCPQDSGQRNTPPPRFVIPLGSLDIRTVSQHRHYHRVERPPTEVTDYQVMLDAESEDMPLWIFCSRRMLRERSVVYGKDNPQHPIFNGAMQNEDYGYDTACILDSVHRLEGRPGFEEACEMVRKTRAVLDPGSMEVPAEKVEGLIGGPLPNK